MKVKKHLYFIGIDIFSPDVYFQNHQVMVTSFGCCCRYSRGAPRVLIIGVPATCKRKWVRVEMEDGRGMVMEDESVVCIGNLSGRLVLILNRACTLV